MSMSNNVKSVAIVCGVAVLSFFVAQAVIPEKSAVIEQERAEAAKVEKPKSAPKPKPKKQQPAAAVVGDGDIQVVVVDNVPVENPIIVPEKKKPVKDKKNKSEPVQEAAVLTAAIDTVSAVSTKSGRGRDTVTAAQALPPVSPMSPMTQQAARTPQISPMPQQITKTSQIQAPAPQIPQPPQTAAKAPSMPTVAPTSSSTVSATAPTPAPATPTPAPARLRSADTPLKIERAAVCTAIEDRVPKGAADKFSKDSRSLYFFTHVTGAGDTSSSVMHRWYHEGKLVQTSILQVKSSNWRTHSRRSLVSNPSDAAGSWKVEAVEPKSGKILETAIFIVE